MSGGGLLEAFQPGVGRMAVLTKGREEEVS